MRLVMLYTLHYEGEVQRISSLMDFLVQAGVRAASPNLFAAAEGILRYAGRDR